MSFKRWIVVMSEFLLNRPIDIPPTSFNSWHTYFVLLSNDYLFLKMFFTIIILLKIYNN